MPYFTIPIHEYNQCHTPSGPDGGQFCSTGGAARPLDIYDAQIIRPGQRFDIVAAAAAGDQNARRTTRRFLFDPKTRNVIIGVAYGVVGRDQSHAEAHALVDPRQPGESEIAQAMRYDTYRVHGHIQRDTRKSSEPMAIVIDRVIATELTPSGFRKEAPEVEALDALYGMASRFAAMGAPRNTGLLARELGGTWTTLGKAFPELFKNRRRAA